MRNRSMLPGMNFAIAFESVFPLTLGRLNEIPAAVAALSEKAH